MTKKKNKLGFKLLAYALVIWTLAAILLTSALAAETSTYSCFQLSAESSGKVTIETTATGWKILAYGTNGSCNSTSTQTVTFTITNTGKKDDGSVRSVDFNITTTNMTANDTNASKTLDATTTSLTYTATSGKGASSYTTITIDFSGISQESLGARVETTFKAVPNATVTVDGTTLTADTKLSKTDAESYSLAVNPASGYKVFGWMSQTDGVLNSNGATTLTYTGKATSTVWPLVIKQDSAVYYIKGASPAIYYGYLDEAITAAGSSGTIIPYQSGVVYGASSSTFTLSGQTLLVPYSATALNISTSTSTDDSGALASTWIHANNAFTSDQYDDGNVNNSSVGGVMEPETSVNLKLTIPSGTTLNVNSGSKLVVGGTIVSGTTQTGGVAGATAGAHSNVYVDGTLNVNSGGVLSVTGYVLGNGKVNITGGEAYQPFVMVDYHDGHHTANSTKNANFPIYRYSLMNIRPEINFSQNGKMFGYVDIYTQETNVYVTTIKARHNVACVGLIGDADDEALIQLASANTTVKATYDSTDYVTTTSGQAGSAYYSKVGKTNLTLDGGASLGNLSISVYVPMIGAQTSSSKTVDFPLPYHFGLNLENGTYNIPYTLVMFPGSSVHVKSGATLSVLSGGKFVALDGLHDHTSRSGSISVGGWYEYHYPSTANFQNNHSKGTYNGTSNFIIDGTLNVASGGSFGGYVQTNGTGTVIMSGTPSATVGVGNVATYGTPVNKYVGRTEHTLNAWLFASNGNVITMETGKTYQGVDNGAHNIASYDYIVYTSPDQATADATAVNDEVLNASVIGSWRCADGNHTDTDNNHICEICGQNPCSECADTDDHNCDVCGKTLSECADTDGDSKCDVCGANLCEHTNKETITGKAATCTETGLTDGEKCSDCGTITKEQTEIPALQHDYTAAVTTEPTCESKGVKTYTCRNDASHTYTEEIAALGHEYDEGVVTTAPTCANEGVKTFTCQNDSSHTYTEAVAKVAHSYGTVSYSWTNYTACVATRSCTVCAEGTDGHTETANATISSAVTTDATCTNTGLRTYTASFDVAWATNQTATEEIAIDEDAHTEVTDEAVAATCTTAGKTEGSHCSVCTKVLVAQEVVPALGHTDGAVVVENNAPATCTADGSYDNVTYCTVCGVETGRNTVTVPATGHTEVIDAAVAATCSETGLTEGSHCSVCKEVLKAQEVVPATDHTPGAEATCTNDQTCTVCGEVIKAATGHSYSSEVTTQPTCTETGVETFTCSKCGDSYTEEIEATGHSYSSVVTAPTCTEAGYTTYTCTCGYSYTDNSVEATGHSYEAKVTAPTCTEAGYTTYTCSVCGNTYTGDSVAATGHSYSSVVTAPTCTEAGYTTHTCSACGNSYTSDEVAALGHTEVIDAAVDATCTDTGLTEGKHCSVCNSVLDAQDVIPALGHSYDDGVITTDPTCNEEGVKTFTCATCGDTYTEAVDATGHTPVVDAAVAPDCTNTGLTEGSHCDVCKAVIVKQEVVDALGHSYEAVVTAPTCTDAGYTTYTCSVCGDSYVADEVAATGHSYSSVVTAPTCTAKGYTTYTCSVCGDTYTGNETDMVAHTPEVDAAVAPTCTKTGLTEGSHCSVCDHVIVAQETVAAKGHTWTPATFDDPKTCSVCGATEGEALVAVAQVGETKYETLAEAVAAAQDGETVTLLVDASGAGVVINKSITIDFGGHTYTFTEGVGSTGTPSNGLQLLSGDIVLKNGTLNVAAESKGEFYILVQNYTNLTVTDMNLDGTNLDKWSASDGDSYVLSNNSGTVNVTGNTNITANDVGDKAFAFDVCKYMSYDAPIVNVSTTGTIAGKIEVSAEISNNLNISGGTYTVAIAEAWCAEGYIPTANTDGTYSVKVGSYVAQVGETKYETLAEAVAAAQNGDTVTLLSNASGAGVVINKSITIDFGGYTYSFTEGVGSTGTLSNGFQILQGNTVTLKNGTLNVVAESKDKFYILVQNYANLTVTDMTLDGTNLDKWSATDGDSYVLSNNSGTVNVTGNTSITANDEGDKAFAFDVCKFESYDAPTVNVSTTGTITGKIEVSAEISNNLNISGGTYTVEIAKAWCAEGYCPTALEDNKYGVIEHIEGSVVVENEVAATCTVAGSYDNVVYCTKCKAELSRVTVTVDALGHTAAAAVEEKRVESTCTVAGSYDSVVYCSVCNAELSRETKALALAAHTEGEAVVENERAATCTAEGSYDNVVYCTECNAELSRNTISVDKIAHAPAEAVKENETASTCTIAGSYDEVVYCSECDAELSRETKALELAKHTAGNPVEENRVESTCTVQGSYYQVIYCTVCNAEMTRTEVELNPADHTPAAAVEENRTESTCTVAGSYDSVVYCSVCNAELSRETKTLELAAHTEGEVVVENKKAATCTAEGSYDNVVYCTVCNAELSRNTETVKALGHDKVSHEAKAPTCTEIGWDAYVTCSRCDYSTKVEKAALGHNIVVDAAVAATCTETGLTEGKHCSVCGEVLVEQETVDALGHDYEGKVTTDPTCTEKGVKTFTCKNDTSHTYTEEVAATGHTLTQVEAKAATCEAIGWNAYEECSVCDYTTYKEIAALGHDYAGVVTTAPTCTEKGVKTYTCKNNANHTYTEEIAATGHTEEVVAGKAATCTETGLTEGKKCTVCGETTVAQEEITALGHTKETIPGTAATCTTAGLTAGVKCTVCGESLTAQEVIPVLGHTEATREENRVEATCGKDGSYDLVTYCSVCKAVIKTEAKTIPATGEHSFTKYEANTEATFDANATEKATCDNCDVTDTREIEDTKLIAIAEVAGQKYTTLAEAVEKAEASATVTLLKNTDEAVTVSKALTINKGEFTATITAGEGYELTEADGVVTVAEKAVDPTVPVPTTNKHTVRYQAGVVEPWFLRINFFVKDSSGKYINPSNFEDYGAFAIRMSDLENAAEVIANKDYDAIIKNVNMTAYTKGIEASVLAPDNHAMFEATVDNQHALSFRYRESIYTYEMADPIVYFCWYVDNDGLHYTPIVKRSIIDFVKERKDTMSANTNLTEKEKLELDVLKSMSELYDTVLAHRGSDTSAVPSVEMHTVGETTWGIPSDNSAYKFSRKRNIILIEPWGLRINARVRYASNSATLPYNDFDDYGIIVYHAKNNDIPKTPTEMLALENAYVFSKSYGTTFLDTIDGNLFFCARYNKNIFTYELDSSICYMFYIKDGENYYYSPIVSDNIKTQCEAWSVDNGFKATEQAIMKAMVSLYETSTAYRYYTPN